MAWWIGVLGFASSLLAADENRAAVDFGHDVLPVLAKRCFACHGPDKQEAGLRFDQQASAKAKLESGATAIVAGKSAASEIVRRISSTDDAERMPPSGKPLSSEQITAIRRWIDEGANWQEHWAFRAPLKMSPPAVKNGAWVKNPIDAFVLSKLEQNGLAPNSPADRTALLRRAYYDLTGLPPSPADVDAFLADQSANAFEKVIDRLLDSKHYGEKWGRHWLDVVRYADTNSFERDGRKPHSWRYRDYVIRSFNDDKPYDQFIREQLAGDEMPNPSPDQVIATGFMRLGLWDDEPADRLLAKYDVLDDVVTTTSQVFLGLTINCARCHDHKIDPIQQRDYYGMVAFFHGLTNNGTNGPNVERAIFENDAAKLVYEQKVRELDERRNRVQAELMAIEAEFQKKFTEKNSPSIDDATTTKSGDKPKGEKKGPLDVHADVKVTDLDELEYRFYRDHWDTLPDFDNVKPETVAKLPNNLFDISPATRTSDFGFVFTGFLKVPRDGDYLFNLDSDDGSRLIVGGKKILEWDGIHGTGMFKTATIALKQGRVPVRLEYFQRTGGHGLVVSWSGPGFGERLLSTVVDSDGTSKIAAARNQKRVTLAGKEVKAPKGKGKEPLSGIAARIKSSGAEVMGASRTAEYENLTKEMDRLKNEKVPVDMALCVTEVGPNSPDTFVLGRGNPRSEGEKVQPRFPGILGGGEATLTPPAPGAKTSGRRTVLADWIASPENRLTSRVMVNRLWQHHFGRGIARSPNNFGFNGDPPTHVELIDWLAGEFVRGSWRMKGMHKLIMMSNTYQMSSRGNDAALAKDPTNNLFWRYDMRRLTAEEIRDSIHVVSGLFNPAMYGPGIYPDISAEVMAGQSRPGEGWGKSSPEEQARRSVYIHIKRSLITPILADFDFCDTDGSCAARFSTTQPTQALGMMNGEFLNKQATIFADRLRREAGDKPAEQVRLALRLALSRPADAKSVSSGEAFLKSLQEKHKLDEKSALNYFCLMVLNLNEFVYLD